MTGDCPATRPGFRRPLLLRRSSLPRRDRNNAAGLLVGARQRWIVPGVGLGAVPPCGRGVVIAPLDELGSPIPEGVLPNVPGIAPVGLSSPGAGVDSCGLGAAGDADGSDDEPSAGGVDGVRPPPGVVVPGAPIPGAAPVLPAPVPPMAPPVAPEPTAPV